jgi:nucleoredoxin
MSSRVAADHGLEEGLLFPSVPFASHPLARLGLLHTVAASMKLLSLGLLSLALSASPLFAEAIAPTLKGDLVALKGKHVGSFDDASLANTKYFAIYYSASWCGPCRKFTPELVKWYNEQKPKHSEFELIFVGHDFDEKAMDAYMTGDDMPWPALKFSKIKSNKSVTHYCGKGIPCLVFVDAEGKILADSYVDGQYVGPHHVLTEIDKTLATSAPSASPTAATGGGKPATYSPSGTNFDEFFKKKTQ